MVDSIWEAQQSTMVCFSFTAGWTWGRTASQAKSTNTFFSHLAGAQFPDCITCFTKKRILNQFQYTIAFLVLHICLSLHLSEYISFQCSIRFPFLHPSVLPKAQQSSHQYIFSRLAGEHSAYCITCLVTNNFVSV